MKHVRWWLGGILLLGMVVRVTVAIRTFHIPFDSGTVGLMALHILEGERPLFLYGFNYSGALLAYLVAFCFKVGGVNLVTFLLPTLLFSLGHIFLSYLLFKEWFDERAGLAAALLIAVPDGVSLSYGFTPDCSYSPLFFLGTLILLLATRIGARDVSPRAEWAHLLGLGLATGLGLWTHLLILGYAVPASLLILPRFWRRPVTGVLVVRFVAGGLLMLLCLLPYLHAGVSAAQGTATTVHPQWPIIQMHWDNLLNRALPGLYLWPMDEGGAVRTLIQGFLLLGAGVYLLRVLMPNSRRDLVHALFPLVFSVLFLALYLPHRQAMVAAPRYVIPLWVMAISAMTALPLASAHRVLRVAGAVLLTAFCLHNLAGMVLFSGNYGASARSLLQQYETTIARARDAGADVVTLIGDDEAFRALGQTLTFMARDEIQFISYVGERYQPAAQAGDAAERPGFAVDEANWDSLVSALQALDVSFEEHRERPVSLLHSLRVPQRRHVAVPAAEMEIRVHGAWAGDGSELKDRKQGTFFIAELSEPSGMTIDLGRERDVEGFALVPLNVVADRLPAGHVIDASVDGVAFREVHRAYAAKPFRYIDGPNVFVGDAYGRQESRFDPIRARYLRYRTEGAPKGYAVWRVSEVFVLETAPGEIPDPEIESEAIIRLLEERNVRFTACDRWLSARLWASRPGGGREPAFARYNDFTQSIQSRRPLPPRTLLPGPEVALAVPTAVAADQEAVLRVLYGDDLDMERVETGHYTTFFFRDVLGPQAERLRWNGLLGLP